MQIIRAIYHQLLVRSTCVHLKPHTSIDSILRLYKYYRILTGIILLPCVLGYCPSAEAQTTVGLFGNTAQSFPGYTLFAPIGSQTSYLIDNCGEKVHSWASNANPSLSAYLLEDGTLLRTASVMGIGEVQLIDWSGSMFWNYSPSPTYGNLHHDVHPLPNGNILLVVRDVKTQADVANAGSSTTQSTINSEQILEIQPDLINGGGTVVWQWKVWDHLIQDVDNLKPNYDTVALHPERIDINYLSLNSGDWLHFNSVAYNEEFDQIAISCPKFNEVWIIDHSATTLEAAGSTGGTHGKGGDLLYRWGNPEAYDQGAGSDKKLFFQHDVHWIPDSYPDGGSIIVYNNRAGTAVGKDYSTVNVFATPADAGGFYPYSGGAYAPTNFSWTYTAPNDTDFFSATVSGAQRLENGNTLICEGASGHFFEIDASGSIVWEYVNPVNGTGPMNQGDVPVGNSVFRCTRYAPDYAGLSGKTLVPQGYIEIGSLFTCDLFDGDTGTTAISPTISLGNDFAVFPNPASEFVQIKSDGFAESDLILTLQTVSGKNLRNANLSRSNRTVQIDVRNLEPGIYFVSLTGTSGTLTRKLLISR